MTSFGKIINAAGTQSKDEFVDALVSALPPIYDKENTNTLFKKLYDALADELVTADVVLETVAHNNYLSVDVLDELILRGRGDHDRLQNENAHTLDKIRFTSRNNTILQNVLLEEGNNQVQIFFIPESNIDINIFDATDSTRTPLNFPTSFDSDTNTLTVVSERAGSFTIEYRDTGDVLRKNENIQIPTNLFRLGWNEGFYNELGYGE